MKIKIISFHQCDAKTLWCVNINWQYFEKFTSNHVKFKNLPNGNMHLGQDIIIQSAPKNSNQYMNWHIKFIEFSQENFRFVTMEKGGLVKYWRHVAQIRNAPNGVTLIDEIEIKAGFATLFFALWAKLYYLGRRKPRQEIINQIMAQNNG